MRGGRGVEEEEAQGPVALRWWGQEPPAQRHRRAVVWLIDRPHPTALLGRAKLEEDMETMRQVGGWVGGGDGGFALGAVHGSAVHGSDRIAREQPGDRPSAAAGLGQGRIERAALLSVRCQQCTACSPRPLPEPAA